MALLVAIITFVTALVLVFAIWLLVGGGSEEDIVRRRLDAVRMAEQRGTTDPQDLHIVRDEMLSTMPALNRLLLQWHWVGGLNKYIYQAGLTIRPAKILLLSGVLGLGTYLVLGFIYGQPILSLFVGLAVAAIPL